MTAISKSIKIEYCRSFGRTNLQKHTERIIGMSRLSELYKQAESLNEEIPAELARKIRVYAEIMQIIGKYHAAAVNDYGRAYAERKRVWGESILKTEGTGM